jgi:hypothetical protein
MNTECYLGPTLCPKADMGSNFARHENEQTSDVVLNHVKRFERNNYTGVDDGDRNITDGRIDLDFMGQPIAHCTRIQARIEKAV